jgi:two-component system sensor histidine kinase MprB
MSFRLRLTMLASLAVAISIAGASLVVYYVDRSQQMHQVDAELTQSRALLPPLDTKFGPQHNAIRLLGPNERQIVLPNSLKAVRVKVRAVATSVATPKGSAGPQFTTRTIGNVRSRVLTVTSSGLTVRLSTSLQDVDRNLARLRWVLLFVCLGGIGAAVLLGALVSRSALAPLRQLTETTERIVETGDLTQRTGQRGRDEISRLSVQLDALLAGLDASLHAQRQLVADASHELRTPLAALRANVELLSDPGALDQSERDELATDVREELESMTALVGELVELARGEEQDVAPTEVRLDLLVQQAVERTAKRAPQLVFHTEVAPSVVRGVPERIERAVMNLLDNARKWSSPGGIVEVRVEGTLVEVRDRGPGISDGDLPRVFDRFYRSPVARGMPGAGLGLAIVKQIAESHGGSVAAEAAPGGGTLVRLQLSPSH